MILALDLATRTGWAVGRAGPCPMASGVEEFHREEDELPGLRYYRFRVWLRKMLEDWKPSLVVYEGSHHRGGPATEMAAGWATRVQEEAALAVVLFRVYHSSTIKKFATGHGNAKKPDMERAARARWPGVEFVDDNEIDALWLWSYAVQAERSRT